MTFDWFCSPSFQDKLFSNDPCIRAILAHLSIDDLATVARVNYVLKINADLVFRSTVHDATIDMVYDEENFRKQRLIFQQFGRLAKTVKIDMGRSGDDEDEDIFHEDGNNVLSMIGQFCGANLQDLTLRGMAIDISSADYSSKQRSDVWQLFGTVKKLTLCAVCIKQGLFEWMKSLNELHIHSCCHMEQLPEIKTLPELKVLKIGACPSWPFIIGYNFVEFLKMNPTIEELDYHYIKLGYGFMKSICALPRLTKLEMLLLESTDFHNISSARKLKQLTVHIAPEDEHQFLQLKDVVPTGCEYSVKKLNIQHADH